MAYNASVYAAEIKNTDSVILSPWKNQVEFGYQASQGNDNSQALNSSIESSYTSGSHRHTGNIEYYFSEDEGQVKKDQFILNLQSDYKISRSYYLYANFSGLHSKYSAYFDDYALSAGFGYQFSNSEKLLLELELGPGFRYQNPNIDEINDDDLILPEEVNEPVFRTNINTAWKTTKNLVLAGEITVLSGHSNTSVDSEISATNNITEDIALKISQTRMYLNRVPSGLSKTNSIFSINLLFTIR